MSITLIQYQKEKNILLNFDSALSSRSVTLFTSLIIKALDGFRRSMYVVNYQ